MTASVKPTETAKWMKAIDNSTYDELSEPGDDFATLDTKLGTKHVAKAGMIYKLFSAQGGGARARAGPRSRHRSPQLVGKHQILNKRLTSEQASDTKQASN